MLSESTYLPSGNYHPRLRSSRDLICCQLDELMFFSTSTVSEREGEGEGGRDNDAKGEQEWREVLSILTPALRTQRFYNIQIYSPSPFTPLACLSEMKSIMVPGLAPVPGMVQYFYKWSIATSNLACTCMFKELWRTVRGWNFWIGWEDAGKINLRPRHRGLAYSSHLHTHGVTGYD